MKDILKHITKRYKVLLDTLKIITLVSLYFFLNYLLGRIHGSDVGYTVLYNTIQLDAATICGILTECQVIIIVCLVLSFETKGYIVGMILGSLSTIIQITPVLSGGQVISAIGFMRMLSGIMVCTLIYQAQKRLCKQKEQLKLMANYDTLTGLANRHTIMQELGALTNRYGSTKPFAVVMIDIDDFKKMNDFAGHEQGDLFLQHIANLWTDLIHEKDILGRIGGDEFALIVRRDLTLEALHEYIDSLRLALGERIAYKNASYCLTASFGISRFPKDAQNVSQLMKYADAAMHMAKTNATHKVQVFSQDLYHKMEQQMTIESSLVHAIEKNEFYLMYQPQYTCLQKQLRGFEVLIRWQNEELGFVSPADFIPLAEKTGDIIEIGGWVLETACKEFKMLLDQYGLKKTLSVNISPIQLLEADFVERVKDVLERTQFDPQDLEFEITESVFISSKEYMINVLNELKGLGIQIALDDFGTNYASLSYIQMLPLDILKIDKSFIDAIDDHKQTNLVGAIIAIAQELNYQVVAEGIEKLEQIQYLNEKGCDFVQGYLWGKPLVPKDVASLLASL